jgi:hypothetical protein
VPDILAIVSKAVFEKDARVAGKVVGLGGVWRVDRYNSGHKAFQPLTGGGRIFLVTVRPPDERLWLLGAIIDPKFDGTSWIAATPNAIPVTDITSLRKTIVFESGKGMSQDKGALGMSLQTPRALAASDVAQMLAAAGAGATQPAPAPVPAQAPIAAAVAPTPAAALLSALAAAPDDEALREKTARDLLAMGSIVEAREALAGLAHLNAHDPSSLPCLCRRCWELAEPTCERGGLVFARDLVVKSRKVLFYWAPEELFTNATDLRRSVRASLGVRLETLARNRKKHQRARPAF